MKDLEPAGFLDVSSVAKEVGKHPAWEANMVVSLNRGTPIQTPNYITFVIGIPQKRVPLIWGNPHVSMSVVVQG